MLFLLQIKTFIDDFVEGNDMKKCLLKYLDLKLKYIFYCLVHHLYATAAFISHK